MPTLIHRRTVYSTPWFDLVAKQFDHDEHPYYMVQAPDYVSIVAMTTEGDVLLVRQYRPITETYTLELPSGHVEVGESPEEAAKRELLEETGYETNTVESLGTLVPDSGRLGNRQWCFFAAGVRVANVPVEREHGIELVRYRASELMQAVAQSHMDHALHLAVILLAVIRGRLPIGAVSSTT